MIQNKIIESKTIHHVFNKYLYKYKENILVKDVGMNEYYITKGNEKVITYGIITCCGIVVWDKNNLILSHLAPDVSSKDVIEMLDKNNFKDGLEVLLAPGFACFVDYNNIINSIRKRANNLLVHKFIGKYGVIYTDGDDLVMGNNKSIERKFKIGDTFLNSK